MKYITLKIPNNRFSFFMELVTSLGFVEVKDTSPEVVEKELLSDEEKMTIDQRLAKAEKDNFQKGYTLKQVNQHLTDKY